LTDEEMAAFGRSRDGVSTAMNDIWRERVRQIEAEGWSPVHDDRHTDGSMAIAAAVYALGAAVDDPERLVMDQFGSGGTPFRIHSLWPWGRQWHKPKNRRRDLVRAAALIVAEIERMDRAASASAT
jgi:hypothetical protein